MATFEQVRSGIPRALAAWSAGSLVVGAAVALRGPGERGAGVARQCLAWGAVDLAIAAVGARSAGSPVADVPAAARSLRRLLLVNAVLDVGYVATGAALLRARRVRDRDATGDGAAVVVQGAFLLLLDLAGAVRLAEHTRTTPV